MRVALQSFGSGLVDNGLGDDKTGKEMTENYLSRIREINTLFVASWNKELPKQTEDIDGT